MVSRERILLLSEPPTKMRYIDLLGKSSSFHFGCPIEPCATSTLIRHFINYHLCLGEISQEILSRLGDLPVKAVHDPGIGNTIHHFVQHITG